MPLRTQMTTAALLDATMLILLILLILLIIGGICVAGNEGTRVVTDDAMLTYHLAAARITVVNFSHIRDRLRLPPG